MDNRIREKRLERGLSQVELAKLIGLPASLLSDLELGKRQTWPKVRRGLAKALKTTQKELFPEERDGK